MNKISAVYKITNTITGDFYIGSSNDVKHRWVQHKCPSTWNDNPNKQLYQDMQKYGVDNFEFQVIAEVEIESLKEMEQWFIEKLNPTYNNYRAKGLDIERRKETQKECMKKYRKTDKGKESHRKANNKYRKSDKYKEYRKSDKIKEYQKEYRNQLCSYNGETLTLNALSKRFKRQGIDNPTAEAKKYLL